MDLRTRRRGTAIVENKDGGILVVAGRHKVFLLPGGTANHGETRHKAAIRELKEETELKAYYSKVLFRHNSDKIHKAHGCYYFKDAHTVVLIKATGHVKPRSDAKYAEWYYPESDIRLSTATKDIIDRYYAYKTKSWWEFWK